LKSRLLLPKPAKDDGPSGEELAAQLAFRLKRLEAMREAAARLVNRNRLGRDVFARGAPEEIEVERGSKFQASLYDLLIAYASQRQRLAVTTVTIASRAVWSLADARAILTRMIGTIEEWTALDQFIVRYLSRPEERASAMASAFAASLELVREGHLDIRQAEPFAPIYLRRGPKAGAQPSG
jgi:segregation and condensation protein A